jgi:transporter family protein
MTDNTRWIVLALLGALFAAIVQVTSKAALNAKIFDAATLNLIRAGVMLLSFAILIGYELARGQRAVDTMMAQPIGNWATQRAYGIALLSGLAASASWYFGYRALQLADVSKTYPLDKLSVAIGVVLAFFIFGERPTGWNWAGIGLMLAGAYLVTLPKEKGLLWGFGDD